MNKKNKIGKKAQVKIKETKEEKALYIIIFIIILAVIIMILYTISCYFTSCDFSNTINFWR